MVTPFLRSIVLHADTGVDGTKIEAVQDKMPF
jgi:hypothetical protein